MSVDEIRSLAKDCEKEARHIDEDAVAAFSLGDLPLKNLFDTISRTERKKAAALLAYAAMVERCYELLLQFRSCPDERDLFNYILRGNAEEGGAK